MPSKKRKDAKSKDTDLDFDLDLVDINLSVDDIEPIEKVVDDIFAETDRIIDNFFMDPAPLPDIEINTDIDLSLPDLDFDFDVSFDEISDTGSGHRKRGNRTKDACRN